MSLLNTAYVLNEPEQSSSSIKTYNSKPTSNNHNKTQKKSCKKLTIENLANIDDESELSDFKAEDEIIHPSSPPNDQNINVKESNHPLDQANNDYINYYQEQAERYNQSIQSSLTQDMNNNNLASPYGQNPSFSTSELQKKLDNILFLLEEQRSEQTKLVNEELILYLFLGVFVIFVLDNFVKVGRYTR